MDQPTRRHAAPAPRRSRARTGTAGAPRAGRRRRRAPRPVAGGRAARRGAGCGRRRPGDGGAARAARRAVARGSCARSALRLPDAGEKSRLHCRLGRLAGDRHRRQLRRLQLCRHAAAPPAHGAPPRRAPHDRPAEPVRRLARELVPRLRRHPRSQPELRRDGGVRQVDGRFRRRPPMRPPKLAIGHARHRQFSSRRRRRAAARTRLPAGGRSGAVARRGGHPRPRVLDAAVRRRPVDPRPHGAAERRRFHRRRRHAAGIHGRRSVRPFPVLRAADDVAALHAGRKRAAVRGARLPPAHGHGTPPERRHPGAGTSGADDDSRRSRARLPGHEPESDGSSSGPSCRTGSRSRRRSRRWRRC